MIGRSLILGHGLDHLAGEQFRHGADADDAGRPQRLDRLDEGRDRRPVLRERLLKVGEVGARGHQQAIDVEQRVAAPRRGEIHALPRHRLADQLGDAGRGRARAEEQEPLIGELLSGDAQRGEDPGQRDAGGALDVVVEGADLVAIARQDRDGVDVGEVLPLDAAFRVELLHRRHELVDEGQIFVAAHAVLAQAEIERVVEQSLIVRADVENDRQAVLRRHAGAGGVERELADRDAHAAGAEIAETEDALAVGDDDEAHVLFRPIGQQLLHPAARADRQIDAARLAEDMAEFLARLADRRRIDERHVGGRVRHQDRVIKRLVARLQIRQHEVLLQIVSRLAISACRRATMSTA